MGLPQIQYNAIGVTFSQYIHRIQVDYPRQVIRNQSASGIVETLNVRADVSVDIGFRYFLNTTDADLKRKLKQWSLWAQAGHPWAFALDSDPAVTMITTLNASAVAGATSLSLTTLTGVVVGQTYVVRNAIHVDVVKVTELNSPDVGDVEISDPLQHSYFSGDRFRSEHYWPARLLSSERTLVEVPPLWYDVQLQFVEDVNSL